MVGKSDQKGSYDFAMVLYTFGKVFSNGTNAAVLIETDAPKKSVELDADDIAEKVAACIDTHNILYVLAFGNDCHDCGQTADLRQLIMALFPPYKTWKDSSKNEVYADSWSMSMDTFRYILNPLLAGMDVSTVKMGVAHSATRDCFDEIALLELILEMFD